ncbi:MAG: hypothetical protein E7316_10185 [Clostridiales bacterium]|nr:hypothetical protein [Clostridiales bacterium]
MKKNAWRILSMICAIIGLALCILAIVKKGEQPLPILGLTFANLGIWTNIYITQKEKREKEKQHE